MSAAPEVMRISPAAPVPSVVTFNRPAVSVPPLLFAAPKVTVKALLPSLETSFAVSVIEPTVAVSVPPAPVVSTVAAPVTNEPLPLITPAPPAVTVIAPDCAVSLPPVPVVVTLPVVTAASTCTSPFAA